MYLVRLPVPEEVDGSVLPPLDDGPAPGVVPLVAPHLHQPVGVLRLHQVHPAGPVTLFQRLQAVFKWPWREDGEESGTDTVDCKLGKKKKKAR